MWKPSKNERMDRRQGNEGNEPQHCKAKCNAIENRFTAEIE